MLRPLSGRIAAGGSASTDWFARMAPPIAQFWREWPAIWRAVAPAWPAAAAVLVAMSAIVLTAQGQAALDATFASSDARFCVFVVSLALFSLGIMASAYFLMATERVEADAARGRLVRVSADLSLRRAVAFGLGMALPLSLLLRQAIVNPPAPTPVLLAVGIAVVAWFGLRALDGRLWRGAAHFSAVYRRWRDPPSAARGKVEGPGAVWRRRARWAPMAAHALTAGASWFARAPAREAVSVFAGLVGLGLCAGADWWPFLATATATALAALVYLALRGQAVQSFDTVDGRRLIIDRGLHTAYRGFSFGLAVMAMTALWAPAFADLVPAASWIGGLHQTLGPLGVLFAGLTILTTFLSWLVRTAIEGPLVPPTGQRVGPALGMWFSLGRLVERAQGVVTPAALFCVGLWLALLDRAAFPVAETVQAGPMRVALWAALALLAGAVVAGGMAVWSRASGHAGAWSRVRIASVIVLAPFAFSTLGENGHVATTPRVAPAPEMQAHVGRWIQERAPEGGGPIPAVIILAEGGGLRAAVLTAAVLSEIDDLDFDGRPLKDHVFAMSGVSGGAIGLAAYLAEQAERPDPGAPSLATAALHRDLLSPLFAGMFASDLPSALIPVDLPLRVRRLWDPHARSAFGATDAGRGAWNRADFFEADLARSFRDAGRTQAVERAFEDVVAAAFPDRVAPMVLFSTFEAHGGRLGVIGTVRVASGPGDAVIDVDPGSDRSLPMVAAAHLSARFPGSNPPGLVERCGETDCVAQRFVDGGYYDNSGAAAAMHALEALAVHGNVVPIVIRIHTREENADGRGSDAQATRSRFSEVAAPNAALWGAREASGRLPVEALQREVGRRSGGRTDQGWIDLTLDISGDPSAPDHVLLGWMLKEQSFCQIDGRARDLKDKLQERIGSALQSVPAPDEDACKTN